MTKTWLETAPIVDDILADLTWSDDWLGHFFTPKELPPVFRDDIQLPRVFYGSQKGSLDMIMADVGLGDDHKDLLKRLNEVSL